MAKIAARLWDRKKRDSTSSHNPVPTSSLGLLPNNYSCRDKNFLKNAKKIMNSSRETLVLSAHVLVTVLTIIIVVAFFFSLFQQVFHSNDNFTVN
jgi:hypothetical protein